MQNDRANGRRSPVQFLMPIPGIFTGIRCTKGRYPLPLMWQFRWKKPSARMGELLSGWSFRARGGLWEMCWRGCGF